MKATGTVLSRFKSRRKVLHAVFAIFGLILLTSCLPTQSLFADRQSCPGSPQISDGARVFLYLNLAVPDAPALVFTIDSLEILVDGAWYPLIFDPKEIVASKIGAGQTFLVKSMVPSGLCQKVRLQISRASLEEEKFTKPLEILEAEQVIELSSPMELTSGASRALLFSLDVEKSFNGPALGNLAISINAGRDTRVTSNLVYVSSPDENTIFVIRIDKLWVVDAFAVTGRPTRLVVDEVNKKLVILAQDETMVKVVDLSNNYLEKEIKIPLIRQARDMALSSDRENVFVLDNDEVVTKLDLVSGTVVARNRIGNRLSYIYFMREKEKLAIASSNDRKVYIVNPESLQTEDSVGVASSPAGLLEWGKYLYIVERDNNDVSIYDLDFHSLVRTVGVGFQPERIAASDNNIYVSNTSDGSVSMLRGGQFSVVRNIAIGKSVREMAVDERQKLLLVAEDACEGSVAFVDTTANHVIGRVEIGAKPATLAIVH